MASYGTSLRMNSGAGGGVEDVIIPANGQIVRLGPGLSEIVGEVPVGRIGLDGRILRALDRETIRGGESSALAGPLL